MYCIKMKRSSEEFWRSSIAHILLMIDMFTDEMQMKAAAVNGESYESKYFTQEQEVVEITSMKQIQGWC